MTKRIRRNKRKKQRNIIIISVVCLTFIMVTAYSAFSTKLSIGAKGSVVDRSRTIQSWSSTSNEDFHTDFYRENIISVTFLDSAKVPDNATESWDVSVDKDRGVMAYVLESSSETGKYDLFIGAKDGVIANKNSSYLFRYFTGVGTINFGDNFDTSGVTSMVGMFYYCRNLENIDFSNFDVSKVTSFAYFLAGGNNLRSLDLTSFNTISATSMYHMFTSWKNETPTVFDESYLSEIKFGPSFVTTNVTNMTDMFSGLPLVSLDLSGFDTKKVKTMYHMFRSCTKLKELNLCSFDTSKVTNMEGMFSGTSSLVKIKVGPNWTTANTDTAGMFTDSSVSSVTTGEC